MCLCFYVSHMLFVRDKPRSLQWHILKYESFVSAPDVVTKSLLEFLGVDTGEQVMARCREAAKQDSQEGSVLSRQKMKGVSCYLPDNFNQVANMTFEKFGLPSTEKFDTMIQCA